MRVSKTLFTGIIGCVTIPICYRKYKRWRYWHEYHKRHCDLHSEFVKWKPDGESLVRELRDAADKLEYYQRVTGGAKIGGGVTTLTGSILMGFTVPLATLIATAGIATSVGAAGMNYVISWRVQSHVKNMLEKPENNYHKLRKAADELNKMIPDMVYFVKEEDYRNFLSERFSNERESALAGQTKTNVINEGSPEDELPRSEGILDYMYNVGKAAILVLNVDKLAQVVPYIKYMGLSHKVIKAKMIQEAVNIANLAKDSGVTGAAGRALRLAEINKATQAMKMAKEGVKMGSWGTFVVTAGYVIAIADIAVNVNDLANGSISAESANYRETADSIETMMYEVDNLLGLDVNKKYTDMPTPGESKY